MITWRKFRETTRIKVEETGGRKKYGTKEGASVERKKRNYKETYKQDFQVKRIYKKRDKKENEEGQQEGEAIEVERR
jgi:hypothetical protein